MDTYMDTYPIFPPSLTNKKLDKLNSLFQDSKYSALFNRYLLKKNPLFLISAIRGYSSRALFNGRTIYDDHRLKVLNEKKQSHLSFQKDEYKSKKLPDYFVLWESLEYWNMLTAYEPDDSVYEKVKNILNQFSPLLISQRQLPELSLSEDGLVHVRERVKDSKPYIYYIEAEMFLNNFDVIMEICKEYRKKHYNNAQSKKLDILRKLNDIGLSLNIDNINISSLGTIDDVSNLIATNHKNICKYSACNSKVISKKLINNLLKKAKKGEEDFLIQQYKKRLISNNYFPPKAKT